MVLLESRFTLSVVTSCQFLSLFLYISSFPVFFFFSFFFFPSQDARGELESRRSVPVTESLRAAATPLPLLWHVFPSVAAIRSVSRLLWGDQRSGRGWGAAPGLPPPPRRWGGTRTLWSVSDSDIREKTSRRLGRSSSVEMAGWTWIFRKTDAMRVLTPHSRAGSARVCVIVVIRDWALHHEKVPTDKNHQSVFQSF